MGKRKDLIYWNIPVTKTLDEAVVEAIKVDMHVSKSDLVRDAVRRLLKELDISERGGFLMIDTEKRGADPE